MKSSTQKLELQIFILHFLLIDHGCTQLIKMWIALSVIINVNKSKVLYQVDTINRGINIISRPAYFKHWWTMSKSVNDKDSVTKIPTKCKSTMKNNVTLLKSRKVFTDGWNFHAM